MLICGQCPNRDRKFFAISWPGDRWWSCGGWELDRVWVDQAVEHLLQLFLEGPQTMPSEYSLEVGSGQDIMFCCLPHKGRGRSPDHRLMFK